MQARKRAVGPIVVLGAAAPKKLGKVRPRRPVISDKSIFSAECEIIAMLAGIGILFWLLRRLRESRPDLSIAKPVMAAFGLRLVAAVALGQLSAAQRLRGPDELTFLARADDVSRLPLTGPDSLNMLTSQLHTFLFSLHDRVLGSPPQLMLRVEMITFSVIGVTLLAAAVYELAGARPALIAAWVLALEPTNVFFSSLIHKEPLMYMAEGMVAFGGAVLWKRGKLYALAPTILGCLIALATRPYVGWFLAAAAALVFLHAGLTRLQGFRSLAVVVGMVALIGAFVPVFLHASSKQNLTLLQQSQDANASDKQANLSLERVDYSSRGKIILNLPKRVADVITRPYLWQTQNASQRLGVIGTLAVLASLFLLVRALLQNGRAVMQRAGPLVYPGLLMLCAYALSAGNAGTAFRYRTHIMAIALALVIVLREHRRQEQSVAEFIEEPKWKKAKGAPTLVG
jgi:hypothetical protein